MKTKLETVGPVRKKITVDVPVERVVDFLEKAYQKIQKKAEFKGFRKGKVPRELLEMHFSGDAVKEAISEMVEKTYPEALEAEKIWPVSRPQITSGPFDKNAEFSYTAEFEVHPSVEITGHHGLSLEKTERNVTDELVDKRLEAMRQQMAQIEPVPEGTKAEKGMAAFVDFNGTADGKDFEGNKAENFLVDIGSGSLMKEFEENIIGMAKGETKKIEFDYPMDYFNKELAGKHGAFELTVKELKLKRLPELNDDFAKDLGSFKTLDEVKADIKKRMESAVEFEAKRELSDHAMTELVKKHPFEVPESLVMEELKGMFESFVRQLTRQGKKFEEAGIKPEQFIEQYKPMAENRVRGYYILDAIAKLEKIEVADADIEERLKVIATQANQPEERVREHYAEKGLINGLRNQILHEKTLDFVVSKAKIETKGAKNK
jgi:trigger factor